jgi:transposase
MEYKEIAKHPLSQGDVDKLNETIRGYNPYYVRNRAHMILLLFQDNRTYEDVANIFKTHVNTVRNWAERWVSRGIDGLYNLDGRGAKPIFSKDEEKIIIECLEQEPRSLRKIAAMVEERTGIKASIETLRRIAKKHGKSWKRQRKVVKGEVTEQEYEHGKADVEELKQLAKDGEIDLVYFDATGFSLQPYVPYAWQDIGREGTIGIPASSSTRINILGFMNPTTREFTDFEHIGSTTSAVIIDIMDEFCETLINPTVAIIDNAPIHTSKAVSEKFREWEKKGLTLYFIPRYSPELNLIEILWRKIKYEWMPSSAYAGMDALRTAIHNIIDSFGSEYTIKFS